MIVPSALILPASWAAILFCGVLAYRGAASAPSGKNAAGVLLAASTASGASPGARAAGTGKLWVYVGTYTDGKSKGIYLFHLDLASGKLTPEGVAGEAVNPSFVTI